MICEYNVGFRSSVQKNGHTRDLRRSKRFDNITDLSEIKGVSL